MNLTTHFTREEMQCPCCQRCEMFPIFMMQLEKLREYVDHPLVINSGFRCPKHNAELRDSAKNSLHMQGKAADISWDEFDAYEKRNLLEGAQELFAGIGIGKTYMHVDLGGQHRLWVY